MDKSNIIYCIIYGTVIAIIITVIIVIIISLVVHTLASVTKQGDDTLRLGR